MANKRQLRFAVQGTKRVLPLSTENVEVVFKTGVLTKTTWYGSTLGQCLGVPDDLINDPFSAASWWVRNSEDRRWRRIIYHLDEVEETGTAGLLMPYSEPPSDSSFTVELVTPVFMNMTLWNRICDVFIVPDSRAEVIRHQYPSHHDQRKQAAMYYVNIFPWASWTHFAAELSQSDRRRAIEVLKIQIPRSKDPTLTVDNMMEATDGVQLPASSLGDYLDMPLVTYNDLVRRQGTGSKGRKALFTEFLSHHPYPTWEVVVQLIQSLECECKATTGLAQEVKEKYVTGVRSLFNLCVGHIVNNYEFYQPLLPELLPEHIHLHISSLPSLQQRYGNTQ